MRISRSATFVGGATLLALLFGGATPATGEPITFAALGASFSAENDQVTLFPATSTLAGDPFAGPVTFDVQSGNFRVDYSPSLSPPYALTLSRLVTIDGVTHTITQEGQLSITPTLDTLAIFDSPAIAFDVASRGRLYLTLGSVNHSTSVIGNFPFTITGTLSKTAPVPEPATLLLVGAGVVAAAKRARMRRRSGVV